MAAFGRRKNIRLKTKLILLYVFTILLPLIIISQVVINISGDKIIDQATQLSQENANQLSRNISNLLGNYIDMSNRICYYDDTLKKYLTVSRKYNTTIDSIDAYDSYLKMIRFYGINEGNAFAFLKVYFLNTTLLQDRDTLIFADDEVKNSEPYKMAEKYDGNIAWGFIDSSLRIYASRVFKDDMLKHIGVVSIEIPEERIYSLIQEMNFDGKSIIICDKDGKVISSNNRSIIATSIKSQRYFKQSASNDSSAFYYSEGGNYKVISELLKGRNQLPDWRIITFIPVDSLLADAKNIRNISIAICILCFIVSCVLYILSMERITNRIKRVVSRMKKVEEGIFKTIDDKGPKDEIGIMIANFNSMIVSLDSLIHENYEVKLQVKDIALKNSEAAFYALQSQINPHFLFNTLESIRMKLSNGGDNSEAASMIFNLSKMLRMSLNWEGESVSLKKEIDFVKHYLEINKGRYKDKLDYTISIPEEFQECIVPKLIIQPLVENSIIHGLEKKSRLGTISIKAFEESGKLSIEIEDNGAGMDAGTLEKIRREISIVGDIKSGESIGLKNVSDRLMLHYGKEFGIRIYSTENEGTRVVLSIPLLLSFQDRI